MDKVYIGPKSRLGLEDFEKLYLGNGNPMEAATRIHMDFPTEAKSILSDSWSKLGINDTPERYFATRAKPLASAPALPLQAQQPVLGSQPSRWPLFSNETDRNIAIDAGVVDYNYPSPVHKARAEALTAIALKQKADVQASSLRNAPGRGELGDPNKLLQYQLAGDDGTAKKVLFSLNKMGQQLEGKPLTYSDWLGTPESARTSSQFLPYQPSAGVGRLENTNVPSRLDQDLFYDPEFQRVLNQDPARANQVYSRFTGRDLDSDIKEKETLRKSQLDIGRNYASKALTEGATRDPKTGAWTVLNTADAPEGGAVAGINGPTRPYRQFTQATPQQKAWLDLHTPAITNTPLERYDRRGEGEAQINLQSLQSDPEFLQHRQTREAQLRRSLNNDEINHLADEVKINKLKAAQDPKNIPWYMKLATMNESAWKSVVGIDPKSEPENPEKANWLKWFSGELSPAEVSKAKEDAKNQIQYESFPSNSM